MCAHQISSGPFLHALYSEFPRIRLCNAFSRLERRLMEKDSEAQRGAAALVWAKGLLADKEALVAVAKTAFAELDIDGSTFIDTNEAHVLVMKIAHDFHLQMPPDAKIKKLLFLCDKDKSGALQAREFQSFFKAVLDSAVKHSCEPVVAALPLEVHHMTTAQMRAELRARDVKVPEGAGRDTLEALLQRAAQPLPSASAFVLTSVLDGTPGSPPLGDALAGNVAAVPALDDTPNSPPLGDAASPFIPTADDLIADGLWADGTPVSAPLGDSLAEEAAPVTDATDDEDGGGEVPAGGAAGAKKKRKKKKKKKTAQSNEEEAAVPNAAVTCAVPPAAMANSDHNGVAEVKAFWLAAEKAEAERLAAEAAAVAETERLAAEKAGAARLAAEAAAAAEASQLLRKRLAAEKAELLAAAEREAEWMLEIEQMAARLAAEAAAAAEAKRSAEVLAELLAAEKREAEWLAEIERVAAEAAAEAEVKRLTAEKAEVERLATEAVAAAEAEALAAKKVEAARLAAEARAAAAERVAMELKAVVESAAEARAAAAERVATEQKAAAVRAAMEQEAAAEKAEKRAAADRAAMEHTAAAEKAVIEKKAAAEKAAFVEKAAAEKAAFDQKAAAEKAALEEEAAAERATMEKKAAAERAAFEKALDNATAEKAAIEKKAAAERVAMEQKAAAERAAMEQKTAAEKAAMEEEAAAERAAFEKALEDVVAEKAALEQKSVAEKAALERGAAAEKAALVERAAAEMAAFEEKAAADIAALKEKAASDIADLKEKAAVAAAAATRRQQLLVATRVSCCSSLRSSPSASSLGAAPSPSALAHLMSPQRSLEKQLQLWQEEEVEDGSRRKSVGDVASERLHRTASEQKQRQAAREAARVASLQPSPLMTEKHKQRLRDELREQRDAAVGQKAAEAIAAASHQPVGMLWSDTQEDDAGGSAPTRAPLNAARGAAEGSGRVPARVLELAAMQSPYYRGIPEPPPPSFASYMVDITRPTSPPWTPSSPHVSPTGTSAGAALQLATREPGTTPHNTSARHDLWFGAEAVSRGSGEILTFGGVNTPESLRQQSTMPTLPTPGPGEYEIDGTFSPTLGALPSRKALPPKRPVAHQYRDLTLHGQILRRDLAVYQCLPDTPHDRWLRQQEKDKATETMRRFAAKARAAPAASSSSSPRSGGSPRGGTQMPSPHADAISRSSPRIGGSPRGGSGGGGKGGESAPLASHLRTLARRHLASSAPRSASRKLPGRTSLEDWLTSDCHIAPGDAAHYANALKELGVDAPSDLSQLEQGDFPPIFKLLHRRRILEVVHAGGAATSQAVELG